MHTLRTRVRSSVGLVSFFFNCFSKYHLGIRNEDSRFLDTNRVWKFEIFFCFCFCFRCRLDRYSIEEPSYLGNITLVSRQFRMVPTESNNGFGYTENLSSWDTHKYWIGITTLIPVKHVLRCHYSILLIPCIPLYKGSISRSSPTS